jgi:Cu(I)/Ag(I) efflux system membrane fusion protein
MQDIGNMKENRNEIFDVSGNCEMCMERIETTAKSVKGVVSASWDINTKKILVRYNGSVTSLDAIQKAIADSGHDNVKYRAPDDVYNKLPECCLYRK